MHREIISGFDSESACNSDPKIILLAPKYDRPTKISAEIVEAISDYLRTKKLTHEYYNWYKLTFPANYGYLLNKKLESGRNYDLIIYMGHGDKNSLMGQKLFSPMHAFINSDINFKNGLFEDAIVLLLACSVGQGIADELVYEGGAKSVLASYNDIRLPIDTNYYTFMADFMKMWYLISKDIIDKLSPLKALINHKKIVNQFTSYYKSMYLRKNDPIILENIDITYNNFANFRIFGNSHAVINY